MRVFNKLLGARPHQRYGDQQSRAHDAQLRGNKPRWHNGAAIFAPLRHAQSIHTQVLRRALQWRPRRAKAGDKMKS